MTNTKTSLIGLLVIAVTMIGLTGFHNAFAECVDSQTNPFNCYGGSSSTDWKTKPTFGISYENNQQIVTDGVRYGFESDVNHKQTITDNFWTHFDMVKIPTNTSYSIVVKGLFANGLKTQVICLGVPERGSGNEAESCIQSDFDSGYRNDKQITEVKTIQKTNVLSNVSVTHQMESCNINDAIKQCDEITFNFRALEPLKDKVMMVQGIDWKRMNTDTYLNEGFNIVGEQFTDLPNMLIPSPTKGEGLIQVTESEKYSQVWNSDDGRTFFKNDSDSFNEINHKYIVDQNPIILAKKQQEDKALKIYDAKNYVAVLKPSFTHQYGEDHRTQFLKDNNMMWLRTGEQSSLLNNHSQ